MQKKQNIEHFDGHESLPNHVIGQNRLAEWLAAQPDNFFTSDTDLQRKLELYLGKAGYKEIVSNFYRFGSVAATQIDPLARSSNLDQNLPMLHSTDEIGRPLETVRYHPDYAEIGRLTYRHQLMSIHETPGRNMIALALFYISAQNGEAGHNCPLACTAGVIKVLQKIAPAELRDRFLPKLLDEEYDHNYTGAQFLTEIQGGSDVGANSVIATPEDSDGRVWYLQGQKWFCSNVTADLALVTARKAGATDTEGDGTRGLGLFLVPRLDAHGNPNQYQIGRLKEKLGTRSLATAEVTFNDAKAWLVGDFKDGAQHVINTSRIYNAFACCGNARRALTTAWTYAQNRIAFGQPIIHFPIVQAQITDMRAALAAMLAGSMRIAKVWDDIERGKGTPADEAFMRMAVNLNKYRSAVLSHEIIVQAIEILGGNGAIESFSVLPRLLRDNVVYENWEGTHNVLMAQVQRDIRRYAIHEPFFETIERLFKAAFMPEIKDEGLHQLELIRGELQEVLKMDELTGAIYFRPLMDRATDLYYAACMAAESGWERKEKEDKTKARLTIFFLNMRVSGRRPGDITYFDDQVARLSSAI